MTEKVSIIVPVYNAAKYLDCCVESILSQTHGNLEIFLVDDGSTDESGKICDKWASRDNRIKVIHQPNRGVVAARNAGIERATGEWLAFVDADDWIEPDMYSAMLDQSKDADMVWCDVFMEEREGRRIICLDLGGTEDSTLRGVLSGDIPGWCINKIIRRSFYKKSKIEVPANCRMMEDTASLVQMLLEEPRIIKLDKVFYHYNKDNESAVTASGKNPMLLAGPALDCVYKSLDEKGVLSKYFDDFSRLVFPYKITLLNNGSGLKSARASYPLTHRKLSTYPFRFPINLLYWFYFNGGILGIILFKVFKRK